MNFIQWIRTAEKQNMHLQWIKLKTQIQQQKHYQTWDWNKPVAFADSITQFLDKSKF